MNTEITRDLIVDLLPAYLSGEASKDTIALVENYIKEDPEFARLIKTEAKVIFPNHIPTPRNEQEMIALRETKRKIRHRSWHMASAIFFSCFAIAFRFDDQGMTWMWQVTPPVAIIFGLLAIMFWILYFHKDRKLKATGL
jgi:hypothetical protein